MVTPTPTAASRPRIFRLSVQRSLGVADGSTMLRSPLTLAPPDSHRAVRADRPIGRETPFVRSAAGLSVKPYPKSVGSNGVGPARREFDRHRLTALLPVARLSVVSPRPEALPAAPGNANTHAASTGRPGRAGSANRQGVNGSRQDEPCYPYRTGLGRPRE